MFTGWGGLESSFEAMDELRRRMDSLFHEIEGTRTVASWPRANVDDTGAAYVLTAEVPGVTLEDLRIQATQEGLTLAGSRKLDAPQGYTVHRQERTRAEFSRGFTFPVAVDPDRASAELKDGVLKVTLPKTPEAQPRTIAVKAG